MASDASKITNYFCLTVGTAIFAVPLCSVREVLFIAELSQHGKMPPAMAGYLNRRGAALPIYHLAALLGLAPVAPSLYDHILLIPTGRSRVVGLLTSGIKKILQVAAADLVARPDAEAVSTTELDRAAAWLLPDQHGFVPILDVSQIAQATAPAAAPEANRHLPNQVA